MKLNVEVNNLSLSPVGKDFFVEVLKETLELSGCDFLAEKNISVSVALVKESEIQKLNKNYRGKNEVTDVLSFFEYENQNEIKKAGDKEIFLGEIILCYNYIAQYALANHDKPEKELAKVASHGLLHVLGFFHGEKMFCIQEEVAKKIAG